MLRRGMSGKYKTRTEFIEVREKFFQNCRRIGHGDHLAQEVWMQIESFAAFSFCQRAFCFVCSGELPKPVSEGILPA